MPKDECFHCGLQCNTDRIDFDHKAFCCNGCKTVYEILHLNELSCYYDLEKAPGSIPKEIKGKFNYLDNNDIASKLLESLGYCIAESKVPPAHHHLQPYRHSNYPGEIELHREPYAYNILNRPAMPQLWQDAEIILN